MTRTLAVFLTFLVLWLGYFYAVDWLVMTGQGLPVAWTLMPAS